VFVKSINAWCFPEGTSVAEMIAAAGRAGFEAFEPALSADGELTAETDKSQCERIAGLAAEAGIKIASLATALFWQFNYSSPDPDARRKAHELTVAMLERAKWLGTDAILVVPAVLRKGKEPICSYEDAYARTVESLCELAPVAESNKVHICVENVWNDFLLSPLEARALIDEVNSPWVGFYFDAGNALAFGDPADWIRILGKRIVRVHIKEFVLGKAGFDGFNAPLGEGDMDWTSVRLALEEIGYNGPVTIEMSGYGVEDLSERFDCVLRS